MHCPSLADLPSPPAGKCGWPWTEESKQIRSELSPDKPWPKVTIVTPSFNQGSYLEETIRSVLLQGYPDLDYIIIDGGSHDCSVEIIKKYSPWLSFWISEKDRGQPHALNKGMERAAGDIVAYLNSDDWYVPNAIASAVEVMEKANKNFLVGKVNECSADGQLRRKVDPQFESLPKLIASASGILQPGTFWRRTCVDGGPRFDENLHFAFDHDFFIRLIIAGHIPYCADIEIANFRWHAESKSSSRRHLFIDDFWAVAKRYRKFLSEREWKGVNDSLRAKDAAELFHRVYFLLLHEGRMEALKRLIVGLGLMKHVSPKRLYLGAFSRILVTGKPPAWFTS